MRAFCMLTKVPEHAQHAGRHAEIETDAVGMAGAGAGAGADDHLVLRQVGDDLVDDREDRGAAAVDEALAADLDHVGVGQDLLDRPGGLRQQAVVGQRAVDQGGAELGEQLRIHHGPHAVSSGNEPGSRTAVSS